MCFSRRLQTQSCFLDMKRFKKYLFKMKKKNWWCTFISSYTALSESALDVLDGVVADPAASPMSRESRGSAQDTN